MTWSFYFPISKGPEPQCLKSQVSLEQTVLLLKLCTRFHTKGMFLTNTGCLEDFHVCGVTFADWCLTIEG